jgi:hypothetical protein
VVLDAGDLTVRSDWFTVRAQVTLDRLVLQRDSLLQVQDGQPRVRHRREQAGG